MSTQTTRATEHRTTDLVAQARQMSEHYPELYDHLKKRDWAIERALARIPSRADIELASTFNARNYLEKTMRELAPGVGDLRKAEIQPGEPTGEELIHG